MNAPFGPTPPRRPGTDGPTLVERAAERLLRGEGGGAEPPPARRVEPPRPGAPPVAATAPARVRAPAAAPTSLRTLRLDPTRLARHGIYMPQTIANRTTEEFRLLKRAALRRAAQAREDGGPNANVVMVTSAKEGEGKTFVSLNLALSLAVEDAASVVLIDADTAKSSVSRHLGLPETDGLMELLEDASAQAETVMLATSVERLSVIPAGRPHRLGVELLASRRMGTVLQEIAERDPNRIVVLDAPPLLAATEPSALAAQVGQVLFVVETDRTSRAAVQESLGMLAVCPQVGLVLNKARFSFGGVRFGTYYSDYYASVRRRERSRQRAAG